jgi:DNA modification methylase
MVNWKLKKIKVSELKENPRNPRNLTEKGLKDLENSIKKFGVAEPLVANTDYMICGGHGRKKILERLNIQEVDCYLPEKKLTPKQFDELGIRLNKNIAGEFNFDILANEFEVDELIEWGFEEKELDLNLWNEISDEKLDEVPEIPKKAISKLGDLFLIDGKHRVMCGDSTKAEDVEKLMDGKKADMVFTDPPYSVNYEKKNKEVLKTKEYTKIENDNLSVGEISEMIWKPVFKHLYDFADDSCSIYMTMPQGGDQMMMMMMMMSENWQVKHELIWVKNSPVFSMGRLDYDYKHEPIIYGWKKKHNWQGKGKFTKSVWEIVRDGNKSHPTMKPVELIVNAIMNSSLIENLVVDLFLGSGSTLIASEQTKRICYGMELDPIYIDVILKRYKKLYPEAKFECLNSKFDFDKLFTDD